MRLPTCQFGILLLVWTAHATDPVRTLLTHARAAPTWVTSVADTYALKQKVDAVEAMEWQRDADLLCGRWELLATTEARGAGLLRAMRRDPTLGRVDVYQDIRPGRLDNIITVSRDDDGWRSAWTLLAPKTRSSLVLKHAATVEGTRVRASLERIEVDGTRVGEAPQTIAALPLPGITSEAGVFDTTYVDGALRIARSSDALRVFERVS